MGTPTVYDWTKTSNFDCYSTLDCVYNEQIYHGSARQCNTIIRRQKLKKNNKIFRIHRVRQNGHSTDEKSEYCAAPVCTLRQIIHPRHIFEKSVKGYSSCSILKNEPVSWMTISCHRQWLKCNRTPFPTYRKWLKAFPHLRYSVAARER